MSARVTQSTLALVPDSSFLRSACLAPDTYKAYRRAVAVFLRDTGLRFTDLTTRSIHTIDLYCAAWIESEYEAGGSRSYAENLESGLAFFAPRLKGLLREAKLRLRGWRRRPPVGLQCKSYPPMPLHLATLMSVRIAATRPQGDMRDLRAAVAILLSFDCYLRVNECLRLRAADVRMPRDERLGPAYLHAAVHLRQTKTLENMTVQVRDPVVARLLHRCIIGLAPHDRVFPFSDDIYRSRYFHPTLAALGLSHLGFVPHSLRHGGATHDYVVRRCSEAYIKRRGRWASDKSANRYVQTLHAVDLTFLVPAALDDEGAGYHRHLDWVMDRAIGDDLPGLPPLSEAVASQRA